MKRRNTDVVIWADFFESLIEKIESPELDYNPNHVGLANVNCRLKLYYGEEAQLHIYSKKDMGTVIRFCLPRES